MFDFSYFPFLETERLRLRKITHEDAQALIDLYSDPAVIEHLMLEPPCDNIPAAIDMVDWIDGHYEKKNAMRWGITLKGGNDTLIGTCGFHFWEREHRHVDIGYDLNQAYWGRGYITEVTHKLVRWCFDNLDLHRVQADCNVGNIGSERVLKKVGFTLEGIWRENTFEYGRFVSLKQYGLLRREYMPTE